MADSKISQLASATLPLAGTEMVPIVQGGATKQVAAAVQNLLIQGQQADTSVNLVREPDAASLVITGYEVEAYSGIVAKPEVGHVELTGMRGHTGAYRPVRTVILV